MEFIKKNMVAVIVAGAGILALFFALILPGAAGGEGGVEVMISVFGLAFGGPTINITYNNIVQEMHLNGAFSIFGLLSVLTLFVGIVLTLASIKVKGKKLDLYGSLLIIVAGIFMFLLLRSISEIGFPGESEKVPFSEIKEEYYFGLGSGAIIYGVIAIIGGFYGLCHLIKPNSQVADEE